MTIEELLPVLRALKPRDWELVEDAEDGKVKLAVLSIRSNPVNVLRGLRSYGVEVSDSRPFNDEGMYVESFHVRHGCVGVGLHWRPGNGMLFDPVESRFRAIGDGPGCCPVSRLRAVTGGAA